MSLAADESVRSVVQAAGPASGGPIGGDHDDGHEHGAGPQDQGEADADAETWAVLAEDPQEDETGIYLEYIERDTGEAGGISVAATEMLPTRHIEHEEN